MRIQVNNENTGRQLTTSHRQNIAVLHCHDARPSPVSESWQLNTTQQIHSQIRNGCRRGSVLQSERPRDASCHWIFCLVKISQSHSKRQCSVGRVSLLVFYWNYVCISYLFWDIQRRKWRDLENGGRCRSRSLKIVPFDGSYTTFYWSAIESTALCCTIFELFDIE